MASSVNKPLYFEYNKTNIIVEPKSDIVLEHFEDDEEITEDFFNYYDDDTYDGLYLS